MKKDDFNDGAKFTYLGKHYEIEAKYNPLVVNDQNETTTIYKCSNPIVTEINTRKISNIINIDEDDNFTLVSNEDGVEDIKVIIKECIGPS